MSGKTCYVYVIETTAGAYKVGIASNPDARYRSLKTGIPDPSSLLHKIPCPTRSHALNLEKSLHEQLYEYHSAGEWFKPPRDIIDSIFIDIHKPRTKRAEPIPKATQIPDADIITSGKYAGWPLLKMHHPLKEEVLEIIHRVSDYTRRRPPLNRILEHASWRGMNPEQVNSIISELKAERKIIEQRPGLYRFP